MLELLVGFGLGLASAWGSVLIALVVVRKVFKNEPILSKPQDDVMVISKTEGELAKQEKTIEDIKKQTQDFGQMLGIPVNRDR